MFILCIVLILIKLPNDVQLNPGPGSSLNFAHLNVRSLNIREKFEELSSIILDQDFHIVALSETSFNERISSDKFTIPGYNSILRLDRLGRIGGGVAFLIHNSLVVKHRKDLEISGMELLWIEFRVREHYFLCGACYRPPDTDLASLINFYDKFL